MKNYTEVTEFLLLGLSDQHSLKFLLIVVFLSIFLLTVSGNCMIILAVGFDQHLHTPMYFFISNLSFLEICYTSVTVPNILVSIAMSRNTITFGGCMAQVCLFTGFATTECILLAAMACDRYVAICIPLSYFMIMNRAVCLQLALCAWFCGVANGVVQTVFTSRLAFCGLNEIDRLYCEVQPLVKLSCGNTYINDALATTSAAVFGVSCLVFILMSYIFIISAILRIPSEDGRHRAFSTCASHITVVVLYFGALIFMYLLPTTDSTKKVDSIVSVMYSVVTPVLNPIIYSLRNKEMKGAMKKVIYDGRFRV
ncbi:olfactory receptor 5V1-like [Ambystoma mexicanum]|uniref:olfactory receptor 5V1-like n=1 Tax=Ambystoma mexicanum TaxID=8296 RepID=UPI0037E7B909